MTEQTPSRIKILFRTLAGRLFSRGPAADTITEQDKKDLALFLNVFPETDFDENNMPVARATLHCPVTGPIPITVDRNGVVRYHVEQHSVWSNFDAETLERAGDYSRAGKELYRQWEDTPSGKTRMASQEE